MPKNNLFQDMVRVKRMNKGKTISSDSLSRERALSDGQIKTLTIPETRKNFRESSKGGNRRYTLWAVAVIALIFFLFSLSFMFAKATITVEPKVEDVELNDNFSAVKDGTGEDLSFDLVVISGEEEKIVQGGEEKEFSESARGTVTIFNNFSPASQNLDINTRLEGSNGKIYKTETKITVPGITDGKPGSIQVEVYGTEPGESYNSGPIDFTILGFKGTPKYSKFYGRSVGPLTGGLTGKFPVVSELERLGTESELKENLRTKLLQKATDQIPSGFVLFKDAVFMDIGNSNTVSTPSNDKTITVKMSGTLYGLLFNEEELSKKISENAVSGYDGSTVSVPEIRNLAFSLPNPDDVSFKDAKNINFNLKGTAKVIWNFDAAKLEQELLGKPKKDFSQILMQYPNIEKAEFFVRPFWAKSFPEKAEDMDILVNYPK